MTSGAIEISAGDNESDRNARRTAPKLASMSPIGDGVSTTGGNNEELDDQGTSPKEAAEILRRLRDEAFDSNNEQLAVALGRPVAEIDEWLGGEAAVDGDVLMKARSLASARGLDVD